MCTENCQSNNLIYLISCKKCLAQYVGETHRTLGERIYEHLYSIRKNHDTPVAEHFNSPGHSTQDVEVEVISYVYVHAPPPIVGRAQKFAELSKENGFINSKHPNIQG